MLKVRDWLVKKNNAQFKNVVSDNGINAIVRRLSDGQIFYIGDIITTLKGTTKFKIKSFDSDLIHVNALSTANGYTFQIQIDEIKKAPR